MKRPRTEVLPDDLSTRPDLAQSLRAKQALTEALQVKNEQIKSLQSSIDKLSAQSNTRAEVLAKIENEWALTNSDIEHALARMNVSRTLFFFFSLKKLPSSFKY